jgi:hypothetical protein
MSKKIADLSDVKTYFETVMCDDATAPKYMNVCDHYQVPGKLDWRIPISMACGTPSGAVESTWNRSAHCQSSARAFGCENINSDAKANIRLLENAVKRHEDPGPNGKVFDGYSGGEQGVSGEK